MTLKIERAEGILRLSSTILAAMGAAVVRLDAETKTVFFMRKRATSHHPQILWVFTIVAAMAACYHLLQLCRFLAEAWLRKHNTRRTNKAWAWLCLLLDQEKRGRVEYGKYKRARIKGYDSITNGSIIINEVLYMEDHSGFLEQIPCTFHHYYIQGVAYIMFAVAVAATQGSMVAVTGVKHMQWAKLCNIYSRFCDQIGGGLLCGLMASVVMAVVSFTSASHLFKICSAYPRGDHSNPNKWRWNLFYSSFN